MHGKLKVRTLPKFRYSEQKFITSNIKYKIQVKFVSQDVFLRWLRYAESPLRSATAVRHKIKFTGNQYNVRNIVRGGTARLCAKQ